MTTTTGNPVNAPRQLQELGQSLWLDNITRELLESGTLQRYIGELSITGLTSNPAIFDNAMRSSGYYDAAIAKKARTGKRGEAMFFELAIEDLCRAADFLLPTHYASNGLDGFVSLEVSPLLADDAAATIAAASRLYQQARRTNLFIKIPGTAAGINAIEETIFAGVPVNVTLLFSPEQYLAAADAYLRAIERRIAAGLDPMVACVASLFVSRWDVAVKDTVNPALRNRLGIAVAQRCYRLYRELLASTRWLKLSRAGAMPQRLLWASTGTKDASVADTFYLEALAAPDTINTVPEKTLLAFADHGVLRGVMPPDGGDAEAVLAEFSHAGVDIRKLAARLQHEGTAAFVLAWQQLLASIADKEK